jgi:hypothetical protein
MARARNIKPSFFKNEELAPAKKGAGCDGVTGSMEAKTDAGSQGRTH